MQCDAGAVAYVSDMPGERDAFPELQCYPDDFSAELLVFVEILHYKEHLSPKTHFMVCEC